MVRVYVHEALVLVLAASFMGVCIGTGVAWSFTLQRTLFLNTPLQLGVPWPAIAIVAILSALLASVAPAARLTRAGITRLLRSFGR
jgi:hypothetical protein